jgi:hypothetical protein
MSVIDSDAYSMSDSSSVPVDAGGDEALISVAVRKLCDQLRKNDPRALYHNSTFPTHRTTGYSEAGYIAVFQALKENTSVKRIDFRMLFEGNYTKRSALVAAEYVESSKTLQTLDLDYCRYQYPRDREMLSTLLQALSRN